MARELRLKRPVFPGSQPVCGTVTKSLCFSKPAFGNPWFDYQVKTGATEQGVRSNTPEIRTNNIPNPSLKTASFLLDCACAGLSPKASAFGNPYLTPLELRHVVGDNLLEIRVELFLPRKLKWAKSIWHNLVFDTYLVLFIIRCQSMIVIPCISYCLIGCQNVWISVAAAVTVRLLVTNCFKYLTWLRCTR